MMDRAHFFINIKNLDELNENTINATENKSKGSRFFVRESIVLEDEAFKDFTENFLRVYNFVKEHKDFLKMNNSYEYVCLAVTSPKANEIILVNTAGYPYSRNVAIIKKL